MIFKLFELFKRDQCPVKTVATFIAELRRMTEHCQFGARIDDMLRDRVICGLHDDGLQRRLLVETTLSLGKAVDMAREAEAAKF